MSDRAAIADIVNSYENYAALAGALGFRVKKGVVRRHALKGLGYRGEMKSFFSRAYAGRHPDRTAPAQAQEAVRALVRALADAVRAGTGVRGTMDFGNGYVKQLCDAVRALDAPKREVLCLEIEHGPHGAFLKRQECPIADFHAALQAYAAGQTIARGKLIEHIRDQLLARGMKMSRASIEERFRRNTKVRTVPPSLVEVIRGLDGRFRTGLVEIETLVGSQPPAEWLEVCREELHFRSKNAMHRALAQATTVNYETVHKALTNPRPGQRLQKEIIDTLLAWREAVRRGERLPVDARLLAGRSGGEVTGLLRRLSRQARSASELYRAGARALGVGPATVRSAVAGGGDRSFSARGVKSLKELVKQRENAGRQRTYLNAPTIRSAARQLAHRAEQARARWQAEPNNRALKNAFMVRRLELIVAIKEGYTPAEVDAEADYAEALD